MARPQKFRLTPDDVLDPQNARKLAGHVSEIEFFRGEVEKLQAQIAGVYDAADEEGFDKKFIRKVVAIRAKDDAVAQAEQAGIDAYTEALEIGFRSRARVENPEHDADGVIIERLDDLGSVQDGRKMSTDGHPSDLATGHTPTWPLTPADAGQIAPIHEPEAAMLPQTAGSETAVAAGAPEGEHSPYASEPTEPVTTDPTAVSLPAEAVTVAGDRSAVPHPSAAPVAKRHQVAA